jgi:hypothetical protein
LAQGCHCIGGSAVPLVDGFLILQRKNPTFAGWGFWLLELAKGSLTITYFHTGIRTIIGVESFHGPVRDGKGWYQLAMVIRHKGGVAALVGTTTNLGKK